MLELGSKKTDQNVTENTRIALQSLSKDILLSLMSNDPIYKVKKKTYNLLNLLNNIKKHLMIDDK